VPTPTAPAETARSSKKSDTSRRSDAPVSGTRIKKKPKASKPSKPKAVEQVPIIEKEPNESDSDRDSQLSESHTNSSLTTREEPKVIAPHPMNPLASVHKPRANGKSIAQEKTKRP
jgi:hypothetical protein